MCYNETKNSYGMFVRNMEHFETVDALFKGVNHTTYTKHQIRMEKTMLIKRTFRYYIHTADIPLPFLVSILRPNLLQSAIYSVMLLILFMAY